MPKTPTTHYDVAEHLRTPEEMAAYLQAYLDAPDADAALIAQAIDDIARVQGLPQAEREALLASESVHQALAGDRSPHVDTLLEVLGALGLRLHARTAP